MTHAQLTTRNGSPAVRLSAQLPLPMGKLWQKACTAEGLNTWFPFDVEFTPEIGAHIRFIARSQTPDGVEIAGAELEGRDEFDGTITNLVDPELLSFTFGIGHEVTITLSNDGGTTTFALVEQLADENEAARSAAGWHQSVSKLERDCGVDSPELDWERLYDRYLEEEFPSGAPVPGRDGEGTIV